MWWGYNTTGVGGGWDGVELGFGPSSPTIDPEYFETKDTFKPTCDLCKY